MRTVFVSEQSHLLVDSSPELVESTRRILLRSALRDLEPQILKAANRPLVLTWSEVCEPGPLGCCGLTLKLTVDPGPAA
jgi:hypothetical protein